MEAGTWSTKMPASSPPTTQRALVGRLLVSLLLTLGALTLLAAATYAVYVPLNTWLIGQDRYLLAGDIAPVAVPERAWAPIATPTPQPAPPPVPPAPVQIRIPAIDVTSSIVELPRIEKAEAGAWNWDVRQLVRPGRGDLVGHLEGTGHPGQAGNTILAGHNYGYGANGVFLRLNRLEAGDEVYIVNEVGETFTYRVRTVQHVEWRQQDLDELVQHSIFLSTDGPERLTLVTCGGADSAPFPERVYVVAEPVR
jgi:LPXTG-site transpeptidase (sortase) family protein